MPTRTGRKARITIADLAAKANVSRMTVASALSSAGGSTTRVSQETAKRIRKIAHEMHYRPNLLARNLRLKKTNTVGIIIDSQAPLLTYHRLSRIESMLFKQGYRVIVGQLHDRLDHMRMHLDSFLSYNVDGLISLAVEYPGNPDAIRELFDEYNKLHKLVLVGHSAFECPNNNYVDINRAEGFSQIVRYLFEKGHRIIAAFLDDMRYTTTQQKQDGFLRTMAEVGLDVTPDSIWNLDVTQVTGENVEEMVRTRLSREKPDAIVCSNDKLAILTMKALKRLGLKVPTDVAVTGFDNTELASFCEPELTTVSQNGEQVSTHVVALLGAMIKEEKEAEAQHIVVPTKIVIRKSA